MNFFNRVRSYIYGKHIEQVMSPINGELNVYYMFGKYMLYAKDTNYSYGELHSGFKNIFNKTNLTGKKFKKVLILGFGVGSVSSLLIEEFEKDCDITAIEKDPIILRLGKKYFDTGRFKNHRIEVADAYDFTLSCENNYDLIVFDIYINNEIPSQFESKEYLEALKKLLAPNGFLYFNKDVSADSMLEGLDSFEQTFGEVYNGYEKILNVRRNYFFTYSK